MAQRLTLSEILKNKRGFSLMEVMIAITIFTTFITVFVITNASNLTDSMLLREEITLRELCEDKVNELVLNPPEFREALTLSPETKTFEHNKKYKYSITYKRFIVPDLGKLTGTSEDDGGGESNAVQIALMKKVTDSMKEMVWQAEVTVTNTENDYFYTLSTWLYNEKAKIDMSAMN
jgi:prepilin-type N-terminal cleavage/methylation domain-containing protein